MSGKPTTHTLIDEKLALSMFLDSLLLEPTLEAPPQAKVEVAEPALEVVTPEPVAAVETPVEEALTTPKDTIEVTQQDEVETPVQQQSPEDIPAWANEPFQVMLFKVAGLTLAVPLQTLSGVVEWPGELTEMPGHADFYLGVLQHLGRSVPVVDTARLVFPREKLNELVGDDPTERITRIVLIDEGRWGLACDEVAEVVTLQAEQVRWRTQRTQRKWLLGTVVEHMCALLDTEAFANKLVTGEE